MVGNHVISRLVIWENIPLFFFKLKKANKRFGKYLFVCLLHVCQTTSWQKSWQLGQRRVFPLSLNPQTNLGPFFLNVKKYCGERSSCYSQILFFLKFRNNPKKEIRKELTRVIVSKSYFLDFSQINATNEKDVSLSPLKVVPFVVKKNPSSISMFPINFNEHVRVSSFFFEDYSKTKKSKNFRTLHPCSFLSPWKLGKWLKRGKELLAH